MQKYKTEESFLKECSLFTEKEKEEIIEEAKFLEIESLEYINFEVEQLLAHRRHFSSQMNLVY